MVRTATVKVGEHLALFDGLTFVSLDPPTAGILNSALAAYRKGTHPWPWTYYPDDLRGVAKDCAELNGGELVSCDPQTYEGVPEDAIF